MDYLSEEDIIAAIQEAHWQVTLDCDEYDVLCAEYAAYDLECSD